jgi:hypothetical protein
MVNRPAKLDTIVSTNLQADILSDLAAALAGSLGIASTASVGEIEPGNGRLEASLQPSLIPGGTLPRQTERPGEFRALLCVSP